MKINFSCNRFFIKMARNKEGIIQKIKNHSVFLILSIKTLEIIYLLLHENIIIIFDFATWSQNLKYLLSALHKRKFAKNPALH